MTGLCSVCGGIIPATPAPEPYEGKVRLHSHPHPRPEFGQCIGSRMVTRPEAAPVPLSVVQGELWSRADILAASTAPAGIGRAA